jgi:hypothetical protein
MPEAANLKGQTFGRLTVIKKIKKVMNNRVRTYWQCVCDCGQETVSRTDTLLNGRANSCGCFAIDISKSRVKHSHCVNRQTNGNATYVSWKGMKQRCNNPNSDQYGHYGAIGVTVCDRWIDNFSNFLEDMGERPDGMTIDRVNPHGNYEPSNCRWADYFVQNNNQKRHYDKARVATTAALLI